MHEERRTGFWQRHTGYTPTPTFFKKWSFHQKSNQFFAFVYVFPIRQDNFVDKYLNINLKTGIAVKICFLSTIPQLLCFFKNYHDQLMIKTFTGNLLKVVIKLHLLCGQLYFYMKADHCWIKVLFRYIVNTYTFFKNYHDIHC
jgi:hypothetical protein